MEEVLGRGSRWRRRIPYAVAAAAVLLAAGVGYAGQRSRAGLEVRLRKRTARAAFLTVSMQNRAAPVMGAALTMEPARGRSTEPEGLELVGVMF